MAYTAAYVFGDSLVDSGNALKLAEWYGGLPFTDLPEGAPTTEDGYFKGRFSNGYTFADLVTNKAIGLVTKPIFPYEFEDPWLGIPIAPFASDPNGNNLNFAYGGAHIVQGDEVVPDLDAQTDAFRHAVDGDADPNALYLITMGGNDIRDLAQTGSNPIPQAEAYAVLDDAAEKLLHELLQLVEIGAHNIVITGIPDVGLIPRYDRDGNDILDTTEQMRSAAATDYSIYLDTLIRTEVIPALEALGANVTYVPLMDYQDASGNLITGALSANLPTIAALHGLTTEELSQNLLLYQSLVFFDEVHPNAQANALLGAYMWAQITGTPWIETLPLTGPDIDYRITGTIAARGEVDQLVVSLVAGTTYTLEMLGVSSLGTTGSLADPSLRLLGPSGNLIGASSDDGVGFDASLTFTATSTGSYTVQFLSTGAPVGFYTVQAAVVSGAAMNSGNTYTVDNASAVVLESVDGVGQDIIRASVSYALSQGSEIEILRTTNDRGKGSINLTGNEFDQTIIGNAGNNIIEGKAGSDVLTGGGGKDVFVLSNAAVTGPGGAHIDRITDYGSGDVVDVTQILKIAVGAHPVTGGYVRVTSSGLIQVDVDGGGNNWVTLSTINNGGGVTIRYLSGGVATSVSLSRVSESQQLALSAANSNATLLGAAVAAAGLLAVPAAAETLTLVDQAMSDAGTMSALISGFELAASENEVSRLALSGEAREAIEESGTSPTFFSSRFEPASNSIAEPDATMMASASLLQATDRAVLNDDTANSSLAANAVAMPSAKMLLPSAPDDADGQASATGDIASALAEALMEGLRDGATVNSLIDALPGHAAMPPVPAAASSPSFWGSAALETFHPGPHHIALQELALHHDAVQMV